MASGGFVGAVYTVPIPGTVVISARLGCWSTGSGQYFQISTYRQNGLHVKGSTGISSAAGQLIDSVVNDDIVCNAGEKIFIGYNCSTAGLRGDVGSAGAYCSIKMKGSG